MIDRVGWLDLPRGWRGLVLRSEHVEVVVLPDKGADIYAWVDLHSGLDVLFKTPWGLPPAVPGWAPDSQSAWLARYPGGWQVLCPNGGAESTGPGGVAWGFHGEASVAAWQVDGTGAHIGAGWAELSTRLHRAPLRMRRRMHLSGRLLTITESVTNTSPDELELMWSHHPAFGPPFLEAGCVISTGARTVVADDVAPGSLLAPDSRHTWPHVSTKDGKPLDLTALPEADDPRDQLAYLTDFDDTWFAITNPRLGFGLGLRWPAEVFPHAWFWQEMHGSAGYPWWREAYVCAIEPASSMPGQGITTARAKGSNLVRLRGGETRAVVLEAVLFPATGPVRRIGPHGQVEGD